MKFFLAFAAVMALTAAVPLGKPVDADLAQLEAIIAAINSPNTDPATAALLEEQLHDIISAANPIAVGPAIIAPAPVVKPEPIAVGPAIIEPIVKPEPIAVGPAIIAPQPDLGAVTAPVAPSPVVIGAIPAGASPLVQVVINVKQATSPADVPVSPVGLPAPGTPVGLPAPGSPIVRPEPIGRPEPVGVEVPVEPVQVVEVAPEPVQVVEVAPEPVQVVEVAPVPVEPVQIGVPIIPEAAVILPEELN